MTSVTDLPEHLPGFDVQAGLARLGGNAKLYCELLRSFYQDKRDVLAQLNRLLDSGEQETARELVHSVKGVAGNLSAVELFDAAKGLENSLKSERPANLLQLKENFETRFGQVMETLLAFDQSSAMQQESAQDAVVLGSAELQAGLQALADLLEEFSMDSGERFNQLRPSLAKCDEVEQLANAISELDFDSASELLKKISAGLDN